MDDRVGKFLERKRLAAVLPWVKGELLDIGCGMNNLVRLHGQGIGVDVYDWGSVDLVVGDTSKLPFENSRFDTISIIAALNHIPNRKAVLFECYRLLRPGGSLIITMIPPGLSKIWHLLRSPWDVDQKDRGMKEGEVYGLRKGDLVHLAAEAKFELVEYRRFMLGVNSVAVFSPLH